MEIAGPFSFRAQKSHAFGLYEIAHIPCAFGYATLRNRERIRRGFSRSPCRGNLGNTCCLRRGAQDRFCRKCLFRKVFLFRRLDAAGTILCATPAVHNNLRAAALAGAYHLVLALSAFYLIVHYRRKFSPADNALSRFHQHISSHTYQSALGSPSSITAGLP